MATRCVALEVAGQGWGMGCKVERTISKFALQESPCELAMNSKVLLGFDCDG